MGNTRTCLGAETEGEDDGTGQYDAETKREDGGIGQYDVETGGEDDGIGQYDANNNSLVWKTFSLSGHSKCRIYATLQQTAFRITCGKSAVSVLENRE